MFFINILLLWLQITSVNMVRHEKSVVKVRWGGRCASNPSVLNDCNWCRCSKREQYVCHARVCQEVDMFGHFNDVIREFDPGMGGHGSWRSRETACEPNVQYRRADLLCVCNDDGTWPNPVCRDIFQVLHSVEVTDISTANGEKCEHSKLYLIGCNVCFCSTDGRLDPNLCTNRKCTNDDPVLNANEELVEKEYKEEQEAVEIYADCRPENSYRLGCKNCECLRNNRLVCDNCINETSRTDVPSFCDRIKPAQVFKRDCNYCYCDIQGYAICTTKKCVSSENRRVNISFSNYVESADTFDEETCVPGYSYKKNCNICVCALYFGRKVFACTVMQCHKTSNPIEIMHVDCVSGTMYEQNCLICQCEDKNGSKTEICQVNPKCEGKQAIRTFRTDDLDSLHGYCEPLHIYKNDCNTCKCLSDGKTVKCTSFICENKPDPISVEIIPVKQNALPCPKGLSYKIDCNYCFCLSNGNTICTTANCKRD